MKKNKAISEKVLIYGSLFLIAAFYTASIIFTGKKSESNWDSINF